MAAMSARYPSARAAILTSWRVERPGLRRYSTQARPSPSPRPPAPSPSSTTPSVSAYASLTPRPLTIRQLMAFGQPPLSLSSLVASAEYTRSELPIRLAKRVQSLNALPFIVVSNPYIHRIARLYTQGFRTIASFGQISSERENEVFTRVLEQLVEDHSQNIPTLARGFQECKRYLPPQTVSTFLDAAIHSRIAIRLIAEQHLALSHSSPNSQSPPSSSSPASACSPSSAVGIIDTQLSPLRMVRMCASYVSELCEATLGVAPPLVVEGDVGATFTGVSVHLEYILTELLKNSYRATVEQHLRTSSPTDPIPPVTVTIAASQRTLSLRIRDRGGGISPENLPKVFSYAFTTAGGSAAQENSKNGTDDGAETSHTGDDGGPYSAQQLGGAAGDGLGEIGASTLSSGLGTLAGLGYGLPMARIYATYFGGGGSLDIVSLWGHGCDTVVVLPRHVEMSDVII